ncbi:hypothetical protein SAMN04488009_2169 [Maribacter sedimenticola]|uniref:SnoaL-like domain-containing protein n=1 Tax=Maribacter sedimenticola TaxID=228956 RepID=A0ABY1SHA1_9FLAO|nr:hypothetical protein [Maribacter sedimenticola]SNR53074.1 hypothetical protein SAMN04488009_2169 [Maribacter sedimenticola]
MAEKFKTYFKKPLLRILVLLLFISSWSCQQDKKDSNDELSTMWSSFLSDLAARDKVAFKNASGNVIRCYDCLENTPTEREYISRLRDTDSLWYETIYQDLIYISVDSFIAKDYDIMFNKPFINLLRTNETIQLMDTIDDTITADILVTTTPPTLNFEGAQHSFTFIKTNAGWKFKEVATIP